MNKYSNYLSQAIVGFVIIRQGFFTETTVDFNLKLRENVSHDYELNLQ